MARQPPDQLFNRWPGRVRHLPADPALDPALLLVDARSQADLLAMAPEMASLLAYHDLTGGEPSNWLPFFQHEILFLLAQIASCDYAGLECKLKMASAGQGTNTAPLKSCVKEMTELVRSWYGRAVASLDGAQLLQSLENIFLHLVPDLAGASGPAGPESLRAHIGLGSRAPASGLDNDLVQARQLANAISRTRALALDYLQARMKDHPGHAPHAALYAAFLQMQGYLQSDLNTFSQRHLDYYYQDVLQLHAGEAEADTTVVSLALIPTVEQLLLPARTQLIAGKDATGDEVLYETMDALTLNQAVLASIKTLYIQRENAQPAEDALRWVERIYISERAGTEDGAAATSKETLLGWSTFGAPLPLEQVGAVPEIGLVVASPLLSLQEGMREVKFKLKVGQAGLQRLLDGLDLRQKLAGQALPGGALQVLGDGCILRLSGAKGWFYVNQFNFTVQPVPDDTSYSLLQLHFTLAPDAPACVANPVLPPLRAEGALPMLGLMLNPLADIYLYTFFRQLEVQQMSIDVKVQGLCQLQIQGPAGSLPPNKPFAPFGGMPQAGDTFQIGHPELCDKPVSSVKLHLIWREMLQGYNSLADYYAGYGEKLVFGKDLFQVRFSMYSGQTWLPVSDKSVQLFGADYLHSEFVLDMPPTAQSRAASHDRPADSIAPLPGTVAVTLAGPSYAFGHQLYPRAFADNMMASAALAIKKEPLLKSLNQPLSPMLDSISLDYEASDKVSTYFFIGPFGYGQDAGKLQRLWPGEQQYEGHLYLGFRAARRPDALSLHFELREKSDAFYSETRIAGEDQQEAINWRYLCGDRWYEITRDMVFTCTDGLTRSGIVRLQLPPDIDTEHKLMPAGLYWIQARMGKGALEINRTVQILTQAVPVRRCAPVQRPGVPIRLPAYSITALARQLPQIKSVSQPFASIGGMAAESVDDYRLRVSQRLRHKQRASQPADFEELTLSLFPSIWQAKCSTVNNSQDYFNDPQLAGGDVTLTILAPAGSGQLLPFPRYLLKEVARKLLAYASPFVNKLTVRNPQIEVIKVYLTVVLKPGSDNAYSTALLNSAINRFLAPWLFDASLAVDLGSRLIQVSKVAAAIRQQPYVKSIGPVSILHCIDRDGDSHWIEENAVVVPTLPWSVLLPVLQHSISGINDHGGIGAMAVGQDFHSKAEAQ